VLAYAYEIVITMMTARSVDECLCRFCYQLCDVFDM